jgi:hypothetical protein
VRDPRQKDVLPRRLCIRLSALSRLRAETKARQTSAIPPLQTALKWSSKFSPFSRRHREKADDPSGWSGFPWALLFCCCSSRSSNLSHDSASRFLQDQQLVSVERPRQRSSRDSRQAQGLGWLNVSRVEILKRRITLFRRPLQA